MDSDTKLSLIENNNVFNMFFHHIVWGYAKNDIVALFERRIITEELLSSIKSNIRCRHIFYISHNPLGNMLMQLLTNTICFPIFMNFDAYNTYGLNLINCGN